MKRILVTGATGFVGNEVINALNMRGFAPVALIRKGSEKKLRYGCEKAYGDVLMPETLDAAMKDIYAVIHLVGIIREVPSKGATFDAMHRQAAENVSAAAERNGVRRFIHMSANGTRENAVSMYHITKYQGEQAVMSKNLDWTIFRPSLIFGQHDTFINMLASYMKKTPVFSYFGDGSYPMQPVFVQDVADCFAAAVDKSETFGKTYCLGGDDTVTYKQLLNMISSVLGKKTVLLPVPEAVISAGVSMLGGFSWFPITKDQFIMLKEGNTCACSEAFGLLGVQRHPLERTVRSYLK